MAEDVIATLMAKIGQVESGGNYKARSKTSTASGKYQYIKKTWGNYKGYPTAADAPPEIQEERMRLDTARALQAYGDPALVAVAHFQGGGVAAKIKANPTLWDKKDANGLTTRAYVNKVMGAKGTSSVPAYTGIGPIPGQTPYSAPNATSVAPLDLMSILAQGTQAGRDLPQIKPADYQQLVAQYQAQREQALQGTMGKLDNEVAKAIQNIRASGGQAVSDVNAQGAVARPDFAAISGSYAAGAAPAPTDYTAGYGVDNSYFQNAAAPMAALSNAQGGAGAALLDQTAAGTQNILGTIAGAIGGPGGAMEAGVASVTAAKSKAALAAQLASDQKFQDFLGQTTLQAQQQDYNAQVANTGNITDMIRNALGLAQTNQQASLSTARSQDDLARAVLGINAQQQQDVFQAGVQQTRDATLNNYQVTAQQGQNEFAASQQAGQNSFNAAQDAARVQATADANSIAQNQDWLKILYQSGVPMTVLPNGQLAMPQVNPVKPTGPQSTGGREGASNMPVQQGTPVVNPQAATKTATAEVSLQNKILDGQIKQAALKKKQAVSAEAKASAAISPTAKQAWEGAKGTFQQGWSAFKLAGAPDVVNASEKAVTLQEFDVALVGLSAAPKAAAEEWLKNWYKAHQTETGIKALPTKKRGEEINKRVKNSMRLVNLYARRSYPEGNRDNATSKEFQDYLLEVQNEILAGA